MEMCQGWKKENQHDIEIQLSNIYSDVFPFLLMEAAMDDELLL